MNTPDFFTDPLNSPDFTYQRLRSDLLLWVYRDTIHAKASGRTGAFHLRRRSKYPEVHVGTDESSGIWAANVYQNSAGMRGVFIGQTAYIDRVKQYVRKEAARLSQEHREHDTFMNAGIGDNSDLNLLLPEENTIPPLNEWQKMLSSISIEAIVYALDDAGLFDEIRTYRRKSGFGVRFTSEGFQLAREIQAMSCL